MPRNNPEPEPRDHAWDRLPDEPALWHRRLLRFCELGGARTIIAVENEYRAKKGLRKRVRISQNWYEAAKKYRWAERATAYDNWVAEQWSREVQASVIQTRRNHLAAARLAIKLGYEGIRSLDPTKLSPKELLALLSFGIALELRSLGEPETVEETRITGPGGGSAGGAVFYIPVSGREPGT